MISAEFFTAKSGEKDVQFVRLGTPGEKCDIILKVTPELITKYPKEWEAFQMGSTVIDHGGTPLEDVPGIDRNVALGFQLKGVHNVEQLAGLTDGQVSALGSGTLTLRQTAQLLLKAREAEGKKGKAA